MLSTVLKRQNLKRPGIAHFSIKYWIYFKVVLKNWRTKNSTRSLFCPLLIPPPTHKKYLQKQMSYFRCASLQRNLTEHHFYFRYVGPNLSRHFSVHLRYAHFVTFLICSKNLSIHSECFKISVLKIYTKILNVKKNMVLDGDLGPWGWPSGQVSMLAFYLDALSSNAAGFYSLYSAKLLEKKEK